ncbi:hypothetical protein JDW15_10260 [Aerococcaceae bacterium zg-ZJ1578]|uniref:gp58-like family protein n=1 Tax=Aerococcaceae bacterium zg-252 TaxID=2796928 RepID=UPI001A2C32EF|nr:hypothetical protein [Aerococcaceae bacterium zg-1578]
MQIKINQRDAPALEFKDGRYYYTFTATEDTNSVDIYSDCLGNTQLKRIQIEKNSEMTSFAPPEVYEGSLSGIFKDLKEINLEMKDTESDFWGKIKLNARGMLEEYHNGTLSAEFMKTASGIEQRLRDALTQSENRYSETANGLRREITHVDGRINEMTVTADGLSQRIQDTEGQINEVTKTAEGLTRRIEATDGRVNQITETVDGFKREITNSVTGRINTVIETVNGVKREIKSSVDDSLSEMTQNINGFKRLVQDAEKNHSQLAQTVSGLESTVNNNQKNMTSRITQLAGLIDQKVARGDLEGIIRNSGDSIWLAVRDRVTTAAGNSKMSGREIINAINVTTGGTLIRSGDNKLMVTPTTTFIQNGTIESAMIKNIDAGKITTGTLNAAIVRAIKLDVSQITGDKMRFIEGAFESAKSKLRINGEGFTIADKLMRLEFDHQGINVHQGTWFAGSLGHATSGTLAGDVILGAGFFGRVSLGYEGKLYSENQKTGKNQYIKALSVNGNNGDIHMSSAIYLDNYEHSLNFKEAGSNTEFVEWTISATDKFLRFEKKDKSFGIMISHNGLFGVKNGNIVGIKAF